jgi:hypothetical protein
MSIRLHERIPMRAGPDDSALSAPICVSLSGVALTRENIGVSATRRLALVSTLRLIGVPTTQK